MTAGLRVGDRVWVFPPGEGSGADLDTVVEVRPLDGATCVRLDGGWWWLFRGDDADGVEVSGPDGGRSDKRSSYWYRCARDCPDSARRAAHTNDIKYIDEAKRRIEARRLSPEHAAELAALLRRVEGRAIMAELD